MGILGEVHANSRELGPWLLGRIRGQPPGQEPEPSGEEYAYVVSSITDVNHILYSIYYGFEVWTQSDRHNILDMCSSIHAGRITALENKISDVLAFSADYDATQESFARIDERLDALEAKATLEATSD